MKHAGSPRNVAAPKANAKSPYCYPHAGLRFGTVQAWTLDMRGYRPHATPHIVTAVGNISVKT